MKQKCRLWGRIGVIFLVGILGITCYVKKETKIVPYPVFSQQNKSLGRCTYQVIKPGKEVALRMCQGSQETQIEVPSQVENQGISYQVTELQVSQRVDFPKAKEITVPATITKYSEWNGYFPEMEKVYLHCPYDAMKCNVNNRMYMSEEDMSLPFNIVNSCADVVFYVPQKDLEKYRSLAEEKEVYSAVYLGDGYEACDCYGPPVYSLGTTKEEARCKYIYQKDMLFEITGEDTACMISAYLPDDSQGSEILSAYREGGDERIGYEIPKQVSDNNGEIYQVNEVRYMSGLYMPGILQMPDSITQIPAGFLGVETVGIIFPKHVKTLPNKLFAVDRDCDDYEYLKLDYGSSLAYVKLPEELEELGKTFHLCENLKGMVIPAHVKKIESQAFCQAIQVLYFEGDVPQGLVGSLEKISSVTCYAKPEYLGKYRQTLQTLGNKVKVEAYPEKQIDEVILTPKNIKIEQNKEIDERDYASDVKEIQATIKAKETMGGHISYGVAYGLTNEWEREEDIRYGERNGNITIQGWGMFTDGEMRYRLFAFDVLSGKYDVATLRVSSIGDEEEWEESEGVQEW